MQDFSVRPIIINFSQLNSGASYFQALGNLSEKEKEKRVFFINRLNRDEAAKNAETAGPVCRKHLQCQCIHHE